MTTGLKIGMTFDLREEYLRLGYGEEETAEFDRPSTIDAIAGALAAHGHEVDRIGHIRQLVARLHAGDRWDLVFNIAEGLRAIAREAQVPALLDAYEIPYTFSDPMVLALTLHKGMTKRVMRDAGLPTPAFAEVASLDDLAGLALSYPLFAKPLAEGTGKGIDGGSILRTPAELRARCAFLLERFAQPVLVEEFLPGREFTVGIVGTGAHAEAIGTFEVILGAKAEADVYSYTNKEFCEDRVEYRLVHPQQDPQVAAAVAASLGVWRVLGCRDAGRIDIRLDHRGAPSFIEVNPLAGINPIISDLVILCGQHNVGYQELIAMILDSALERLAGASCG